MGLPRRFAPRNDKKERVLAMTEKKSLTVLLAMTRRESFLSFFTMARKDSYSKKPHLKN